MAEVQVTHEESLVRTAAGVDMTTPADLVLRTKDHPEANGKIADQGDVGWTLRFPLEDGRSLDLEMGEESFQTLETLLFQIRSHRAMNLLAGMDGEGRPA